MYQLRDVTKFFSGAFMSFPPLKIIPVFAICPLVARWLPEYDHHRNQSDRDIQQIALVIDNDGNDSDNDKADLC